MSDPILNLLQQAFEQHKRLGETLDNIHRAMQRGPTTGQQAKRCLDYFVAHWQRKYPSGKLVVNGAKDIAIFKRLLKQLAPEEVATRVRSFFTLDDQFVVDARHSIGVFSSRINQLAPASQVVTMGPVGCRHVPVCADADTHTRLLLKERKAAR